MDFAGKQREFINLWAGAGPGLIASQRVSGRLDVSVEASVQAVSVELLTGGMSKGLQQVTVLLAGAFNPVM